MSNENNDYTTGWSEFDGKAVLMQLNQPYVGVTDPIMPCFQKDAEGNITGVVSVPYLRGTLRVVDDVSPSGKRDTMFIVTTDDPNGNIKGKVTIAVPREQIAFITTTERQLIAAP
jgi:hypothetical protein